MNSGTILFLNGTSSSGKSTLIKHLQQNLQLPYLEMGLDKFIWMLPRRYFEQPLWNEVLGKADSAGALGHQLVHAMHRAILASAKVGTNISWCTPCTGRSSLQQKLGLISWLTMSW
jgi:chloramphenicol 3-O phosphotransferase